MDASSESSVISGFSGKDHRKQRHPPREALKRRHPGKRRKRKQRHPQLRERKRRKAETPTTQKDSTRLISTFSTKLILDLGALEILRQFSKMRLERLQT
jgi:hypothetical protein